MANELIAFARGEEITHAVFGQTARSRWDILLHGSIPNRFLHEVRDATVQVVPVETEQARDVTGTDEDMTSRKVMQEDRNVW